MPNNSDSAASATREKLVEDVKVLTKDVQDLLKVTASVVGEKATEARGRVEASLKVAQEKLGHLHETARRGAAKPPPRPTSTCATIPGTRSASPPGSGFSSASSSPPAPSRAAATTRPPGSHVQRRPHDARPPGLLASVRAFCAS